MTSRQFSFKWLWLLVPLASLVLGLYLIWPRDHEEVQLRATKISSDRKWVAVVQLEVFNTAWVVNDAVYAVRLKGAAQKDSKGDLVMNLPVNYPEPEPLIDWSNGTLVVTLAGDQKYQYLATPVDGVAIVVRRNGLTPTPSPPLN